MELPLLLPASQQSMLNSNLYYDAGAYYGRPALIATPGIIAYTFSGSPSPSGAVQGLLQHESYLYAVIGGVLFRFTGWDTGTTLTISDSETLTSFGSTEIARMAVGENHLVISNGRTATKTYAYALSTGTLSDITSTVPANGILTYQDKMFIVGLHQGSYFTPSDLSSVDWDDYDPSYPSGYADTIQNIVSHKRKLYVFGKKTVEVFYNSGDATAPFARIDGSNLQIGCVAPESVAISGDSIYWLTNTGQVARAVGVGGFQIVSTPRLERVWSAYTQLEDTVGLGISFLGRDFYFLRFPYLGTSFVFDPMAAELGLFPWFRWAPTTGLGTMPFMSSCITAPMSTTTATVWSLIGGIASTKIYKLSNTTYANDGTYFRTIWYPPLVHQDRRIIRHHWFEAVMKEGTGSSTQTLRYTDDREQNWTTPAAITMVSADYAQRFRWPMLGWALERQYELRCDDEINRVIFGATLHASAGVI